MDDRSIIARLDIGREQIEDIIHAAISKYYGDNTRGMDSNIVCASELATDGILDLFVAADENYGHRSTPPTH